MKEKIKCEHQTYAKKYANKYNINYNKNGKQRYLHEIPDFDNQHIIAQDYINNGKTFYWTKDYSNYLSFIDKCSNCHLYEVLTNSLRKIYFDFDELDLNRDGVNLLIDEFLEKFNNHFTLALTTDDLIVLYRELPNDKIESIHIIIPSLSMLHTEQRWLAENIFNSDDSVYNNNKFFNMRYQNKVVKKEKPLFSDFFKIRFKQIDYMINHTSNTTTLSVDIPKKTKIDDYFLPNEIDDDEEREELNIPSNPSSNDVLTKYNLVDTLLNNLPKEFFKDKKLWCRTSKNIFFHEILNIDKWLKDSANKYPTQYSYQKNYDYVHNSNEEYKTNNFNTILSEINTKYNTSYCFKEARDNNTYDFRRWVSKITGKTIKQIDKYLCRDFDKKIIQIATNIKIYTEKSIVWIDDKPYKYWEDYYSPKNSNDQEEKLEHFETKTKEEIGVLSRDFMKNNEKKLLGVNMKWGEGKSHLIIKPILKDIILNTDINVLAITESNNLNDEVYKDYCEIVRKLDLDESIVEQHQNNNKFKPTCRLAVCSLESLWKTDSLDFKLIILDEYCSIIKHFDSSTMYKLETPTKSINRIISLIKYADKTICADADLSYPSLELILDDCEIKKSETELYYSSSSKWKTDYTFKVIADTDQEKFIDMIDDDIRADKRLSIASMSRTWAEDLYQYLYTIFIESGEKPNLKILCKWKDTFKINNTNIVGEDKDKNINDTINENDIDIFLYTPTIKTGVSYNPVFKDDIIINRFNKTYLRTNIGSCPAREALQMIFRVRNLIDTTIIIAVNSLQPIHDLPTDTMLVDYLTQQIKLSFHNDNFEELVKHVRDIKECMMNPLYSRIKLYNSREHLDSWFNLPHAILRKLTQNHTINVEFITDTIKETKQKLIKDGMKKAHVDYLEYQADLYANKTDYIEDHTFTKLAKLSILDPHNNDKRRAITKKKMINTLGLKASENYREYGKSKSSYNGSYIESINEYYEDVEQPIYEDLVEVVYNFTDNYDKIRRVDKVECESITYSYGDDGKIISKRASKNEYVQDKPSIYSEFLLPHKTADIDFINTFRSGLIINNEDKTLTTEHLKMNKVKCVAFITDLFVPFIFINNKPQYKTYYYTTKQFLADCKKHTEVINEKFDTLINIDEKEKKQVIKDFNVNDEKQVKAVYQLVKKCLTRIGFDIIAPKHRNVKEPTYMITPSSSIYTDKIINHLEDVMVLERDEESGWLFQNTTIIDKHHQDGSDWIDPKHFKLNKNKRVKADYKLNILVNEKTEKINFFKSGKNRFVNYPLKDIDLRNQTDSKDDIPKEAERIEIKQHEELLKLSQDQIEKLRTLKNDKIDSCYNKSTFKQYNKPTKQELDKMINNNSRCLYLRDSIQDTQHYQRYRIEQEFNKDLWKYFHRDRLREKRQNKKISPLDIGVCHIEDSDDEDLSDIELTDSDDEEIKPIIKKEESIEIKEANDKLQQYITTCREQAIEKSFEKSAVDTFVQLLVSK